MPEAVSKEAWVSFTKKRSLSLEDGLLVKALEKVDRAGDPEARLSAIATLSDQIKKQIVEIGKRKKELGEKLFGEAKDKLNELAEGAEQLSREASQVIAAKATAAAPEEPDSPALLTTKMIPLVKELQGGDVKMHAIIASTGKRAAVLILPRPISPGRRTLLAEYLQESSGLKYFSATCTGSPGTVEFQLDASATGLSKLLRWALFDQTGLRITVSTRFGDETESVADDEDAATPEAQYTARLKTTLPRITAVMATPVGLAARQVAVEARDLARKGDFVGALAKLDEVDALLAEKPPLVDDAKSRLRAERWRVSRDQYLDANDLVNEQLNSLRLALLNYVRDGGKYEDEIPDIANHDLSGVTGVHRVQLAAALREIGDGHAEPMKAHGAKVLAQVQAFQTFLRSSRQVNACDRNPFGVEVGIRRALEPALQALAQVLGETP